MSRYHEEQHFHGALMGLLLVAMVFVVVVTIVAVVFSRPGDALLLAIAPVVVVLVASLISLSHLDVDVTDRGADIEFDCAHGRMHFTFPFVRKALDAGFMPDTIATDLTLPSATRGPVFDLPTTMSKFLNLGVSLDEVIRRVTTNPARVLGEDGRLGTLKPGAVADVAVFSLERGQFDFIDTDQNHLTGAQKLVTQLTLKDGRIWYRAPQRL